MAHRVRIVEIDLAELGQREIAFAVARPADLALDGIAGAQAEFAHLVGRHVDVVGPGEIVRLGAAQKAETVGQHLDRAEPHDLLALVGQLLEDGEHEVLLAQRRASLDAKLFSHFDEFGGGFLLEVLEMHIRGFRGGKGEDWLAIRSWGKTLENREDRLEKLRSPPVWNARI